MPPLYDNLSDSDELLLLTHLAHELTVAARATYEVGTENVHNPTALRTYNELQHRVSAAIRDRLLRKDAMPLDDIIQMLDELGAKYNQTDNVQYALRSACSFLGDGKGRVHKYDQ